MAGRRIWCQGGLPQGGRPSQVPAMPSKDEERGRRLAAALRDNLRRRKAQARDLAEQTRRDGDRDGDRDDNA
jgi:hypothetical protein